jgi:hypothetical protein
MIIYLQMGKILVLLGLVLVATAFKMGNEIADPQQCIEEKCPKEWAACKADTNCIPTI